MENVTVYGMGVLRVQTETFTRKLTESLTFEVHFGEKLAGLRKTFTRENHIP